MKFILIRHAQSAPKPDSHQSEWRLTADGEQSCTELAIFLKEQHASHIYTSHEAKAIQTAQFTAKSMNIRVDKWPGLEEQNNDGVGWFASADDFKSTVQKLFEKPTEEVFGPESANSAGARFGRALSEIAAQHAANEVVGIATHGRVMTSFLQTQAAVDPIPFWRSLTFPDCVIIEWPKVKIVGRKSW